MAEKVALTGWFSFRDGEATVGDLLALESVRRAVERAGAAYETFWSPGFRDAGPYLEELAAPASHSHMVLLCGPLHGQQVERLHTLFARSVRIAVGVSVIDPDCAAVRGFDRVLARDAPGQPVTADLSVAAPSTGLPPVAAVVLTRGQGEYGSRRRHDQVADAVAARLERTGAALLPLDTRVSERDRGVPSDAAAFEAVLRRVDVVVTNRLHGLVVALRHGVPALAVDPVEGGAKLSAQARAWQWPAVLEPSAVDGPAFDRWWTWCRTEGRTLARRRALTPPRADAEAMTATLTGLLH